MPTAYSYIRFSTPKQQHGSSLERQESMVAKWLQDNMAYTLSSTTFEDLGLSGWKGKHLQYGFGKLLAAIEHGDIKEGDVILAEAWDRVGRLDWVTMLTDLIAPILKAGVRLVTLEDKQVYDAESVNGPQAYVLIGKVQAANHYSTELSRRINTAYDKRRRAAAATDASRKVPVRCTPVWLTKEGAEIKDVADHVRQAFRDYAAGLGERKIVRSLRATGHPAFAKVNGSTVRRWLENKTAIGYWNDIPGVYPELVEPALFYAVQAVKARKAKAPGSSPNKHLMTGLVKCGECGRNFNVKLRKHTGDTMSCTSRARVGLDGCSNSRSIPLSVLEFIRLRTSGPYVTKALADNNFKTNSKRLGEIEGELATLSGKISNLMKAFDAVPDMPELQQKLSEAQQQRRSLEEEKTLLERQSSDLGVLQVVLEESDLALNDPMKLNALLQQAGYALTCHPDGLIVHNDSEGYRQEWRYLGADRRTKLYKLRLTEQWGEVKHFPVPQRLQPVDLSAMKPANPLLALLMRQNAPVTQGFLGNPEVTDTPEAVDTQEVLRAPEVPATREALDVQALLDAFGIGSDE